MKEKPKDPLSIKLLSAIVGMCLIIIFLLSGWKITKLQFLGVELAPPETSTLTPQPTATLLIKTLGDVGGIFWDSYSLDPHTEQLSYWGKTRGEYNGIDSSSLHAGVVASEGYLCGLFNLETPCPPITPTPIYPSSYTNVVYIARVGFDDGEYCFMLIAGKAQLLIDNVEVESVGFFYEPTKISLRTEDDYVRRNMVRGEHEVKLKLFKPQNDNLFVLLWGKPNNTSCSNVGSAWMLRQIP
jgi:hypothetical protein